MIAGPVGTLACGLFAAGMVHVIASDLRHRRIRNWLMLSLAVAWPPLALVAGLPAPAMAAALGAAALVFAAGFACFAAGWVGGGDVKLAAVAALWLGAAQVPAFLLLASAMGGALALASLAAGAWQRHRAGVGAGAAGAAPEGTRTIPYGPALAVAALALLGGSPWVGSL